MSEISRHDMLSHYIGKLQELSDIDDEANKVLKEIEVLLDCNISSEIGDALLGRISEFYERNKANRNIINEMQIKMDDLLKM